MVGPVCAPIRKIPMLGYGEDFTFYERAGKFLYNKILPQLGNNLHTLYRGGGHLCSC